jgi:hypothetical protein
MAQVTLLRFRRTWSSSGSTRLETLSPRPEQARPGPTVGRSHSGEAGA